MVERFGREGWDQAEPGPIIAKLGGQVGGGDSGGGGVVVSKKPAIAGFLLCLGW